MQLAELLQIPAPIEIADIGAAAINEAPIYEPLLDLGIGHLNAFEGDERQIAGIMAKYGDRATIFREFVFDGTTRTVYLCHPQSGMSSLLKPKVSALAFFNGFTEFGTVEGTATVDTRRLDDIPGLRPLDFLKMDIQGGELTVMKNGVRVLRNCAAVQLEVSFVNLYESQPSFGDIDVWMRSMGFVPHAFAALKRWSIAPTIFSNNFRVAGNQLLEADVIYVRDPLELSRLSDATIAISALLAQYCFKSIDLCVHYLLELERRNVIPLDSHRICYET